METQSAVVVQVSPQPPQFLNSVLESYEGGKHVHILTGDTGGLFWDESNKSYLPLDQVLLNKLEQQFTVLTLDSVGLGFFDDLDRAEVVINVWLKAKELQKSGQKPKPAVQTSPSFRFRDSFDDPRIQEILKEEDLPKESRKKIVDKIAQARFDPLAALAVTQELFWSYARVREKDPSIRPLCILVRHAGALFPERDFANMDQTDRQRLVYFLNNIITNEQFMNGQELFVLVSPSLAEVNRKISSLTNVTSTEIPLPLEDQRLAYVQYLGSQDGELPLEMSAEDFAKATAGLHLVHIRDLVTVARAKKTKVSYKDTGNAVNKMLKGVLRGASFKQFTHTADQVYFMDKPKKALFGFFEDCKYPDTAISVVGIWGPNGGGKTWLGTGVAASSGWVVLELKGIRDKGYGESEKILEQLRLVLEPFNHIVIIKDEADTDLGDVRNKDNVHDVDERLYGMINDMMTDKRYLGKILWMLMTARPDRLGSDVRSRCASAQIAIFDLEGEDRKSFIRQVFKDRKIDLTDEELEEVLKGTAGCSCRDIADGLVPRFVAARRRDATVKIADFLKTWKPADAIGPERRMQSLIAAENCTFPELVPEWIKNMKPEDRRAEIDRIKFSLRFQ